MKITIFKDILLNACTKAQKVIATKNVMPSLDNIKFEARIPKGLYLSATDLETHFSTLVLADDIESDEDKTFCLESKLLINTLNKLPNISIEIEVGDVQCNIVTPDARYTMPVYDANDFPLQRSSSSCDLELHDIPIDEFFSVVHSVLFPVNDNDLREFIRGVNMVREHTLSFIATNGSMLTKNSIDVLGDGWCNIVVPAKPLRNLRNLFDGNIKVTVGDFLSIHDGSSSVQITLINTKFPDIRGILPEKNDSDVWFTAKKFDLTKMIKLANIYANKSTNQLIIEVSDSTVKILSQDLDYSISASEVLQCKTNGEIRIGFNGELLLECIKSLDAEEINFRMTSSDKGMLICDAEDISLQRTVLMPLKIE